MSENEISELIVERGDALTASKLVYISLSVSFWVPAQPKKSLIAIRALGPFPFPRGIKFQMFAALVARTFCRNGFRMRSLDGLEFLVFHQSARQWAE
jgi:hypothetical protein